MDTNPASTSASPSRFVQRWLAANPRHAGELAQLAATPLDQADFAALLRQQLESGAPSLPAAMRRLRNLLLSAIVARDTGGLADFGEVVRTISAFADFAVSTLLAALHEELCERHGRPVGEDSGTEQQMIVVGMGKLGGHELNVSSDIDLIFLYAEDGETHVADPGQRQVSNHEFFVKLGKRLIGDLSEVRDDGYCFRVDMALRPNGNSGPLVASFAMLEGYLTVEGREWERYAWVKARAMTGKPDDVAALEEIVRPFVYRRYLDFGAIHALRNMHEQIRAEAVRQETRHPGRGTNVKLGRGGIREVEFLAQVFQLIRGGRDPGLRDRSTVRTLDTLAERRLLAAPVVAQLQHAYAFLRNLEHRLQYLEDAQTHVLPAQDADRAAVAQMMGYASADELQRALDAQRAIVAAQFDAMFADKGCEQAEDGGQAAPALEEVDETALGAYLGQLGFDEPQGCAQRLLDDWRAPRVQALPEASRARLQGVLRAALPVIAQQKASCQATLNRLSDFLSAVVRRSAYVALLAEYPQALSLVVRMMAASDWAAKFLTRHPVLLDELLDPQILHAAPDWPQFARECRRQLQAFAGDTERQMDVLRELHHAQLFRLLAMDLEGSLTVERLADHLSALADVLVAATLEAVWQTIPKRHREVPRFAVVAYGKLGGKELGYASDLDLIFLYDDEDQDAPALYAKLAQRFILWMTTHTSAGVLFDVDVALRPDGASGLMVSSVGSFEKYQRESAWLWEHQALTRARFCAGDADIGARFESLRVQVLRQRREPQKLVAEVASMRKRMQDAHPNRSGQFDLKHDAGGMIDIEFIVQYLVLSHASEYPDLVGDIGNIALLKLCGELGLVEAGLATRVADAYRRFRKMQHQIRMQGSDRARVAAEEVASEAAAVQELWGKIFGERL